MTGIRLEPQFTAPNPVNAGDIVGFNGAESDITLNSAVAFSAGGAPQPNYAIFTWNFGDGTPEVSGYAPGAPLCEAPWLSPCAASVFHAYQYGGTYNVTLSVKDVGANTATATNPITVVGPPPPSQASGSGGSGQVAQGSAAAPASAPGSSAGTTPHPNPVASAAVVSRSLRSVLRSGLVVRYSVNEQVAGHFEVLLATSIARRIGLHGPPATGLAKGTAPQTVIGKAILVTTTGGHSTVKIVFGKTTASRLRQLRKVSLMVRLVVRNVSSGSTTLLSPVSLSR